MGFENLLWHRENEICEHRRGRKASEEIETRNETDHDQWCC
jgi:hypothetical protein